MFYSFAKYSLYLVVFLFVFLITTYLFAINVYAYDLSTATSTGRTYSPSGSNCDDIFFSRDGFTFFCIDFADNVIEQYSVPVSFTLDSVTDNNIEYDILNNDGIVASGFWFSSDGSLMYAVNELFNSSIDEYSLSTPWDITTLSPTGDTYDTTSIGRGDDVAFSSDGSMMYFLEDEVVYSFTLSTPWDLSTVSSDNTLDVSSQNNVMLSLLFRPDGKRMYLVGRGSSGNPSGPNVYQYNCSTEWSLNSCSYNNVFYDLSSPMNEDSSRGLYIKYDDGIRFYVHESIDSTLYEFSMDSNYSVPVSVTGNSFLNIVKPEQGTSTNSRTIDILISGGIDSDELPDENIDKLYMDFSSQAYPTDDIERVVIAENITLDQQFEFSTTTTLNRDGHYLGLAYFTNGEDKVFVSEKVTFNSATTTLPVDIPLSNPQGLCEGGNFVEEGFCKVMVFLFYPSEEATDRFISLNDILDSKVPFGYFHLLDTKLNSISGTSTDPFSDFDVNVGTSTYGLGNIKIVDWSEAKDTIGQDNLDTIETWFVNLLWIIFGLYIAGRTFSFAQNQL